jgi:hypothetical protein
MFGFGGNKRRVRNETFAPSRIRGAALAGIGMLAWQWWRKRQAPSRTTTNPTNSFSETSRRSADAF